MNPLHRALLLLASHLSLAADCAAPRGIEPPCALAHVEPYRNNLRQLRVLDAKNRRNANRKQKGKRK